MIRQNPARIYKAQQRGLFENSNHRREATFNFESYQDASRSPFGALQVLNDETLGPSQQLARNVENGTVLLIPLVGALEYTLNGETAYVETNEAAWLPADGNLTLRNPYDEELINFLYIVFSHSIVTEAETLSINLDSRNSLNPLSLPGSIKAKMGLFDGRQEALYPVQNPNNGLFVFVIAGAFEVQGRLLEQRDGLALWQLEEAEMEALSENAVVLLFELPIRG
ncbi:MAG: pirin [Bacteroidia bacterium]